MVSHDAEDHYGEKTMMFSADDAGMDVTHSHTVLITNDSDLPDQHGKMFSTCGNMDFLFPMDKGKAEPFILPKTTSSSVRSFDPEFENFLASISKPSGPRDNSMLHKVEQNAPMMPHDKENQAPTLMSTKRQNFPDKTVKIRDSSNRGVVLLEHTQGMELTDVFTGHIVENATADDPLQCLFPTPDMYRQSEQREPAERNGRQQLKCSLSNPIDTRVATKPSVADSKKFSLGAPSLKMGNSLSLNLTQTHPLPENRLISQNKNAQHVLGLEEYEIRNTSESDDMDMTKSQTVAIDSRSLHAVTTLTKQQQEKSRFSITTPYKTSTDFENDMDFTRCQTGVIEAKNLDVGKPLFTGNAGGSVRIMADNQRDRAINQENITISNFEFDNMEITQSQTAVIESLHRVKPDLPDQHGEMFSTCGNMDFFFPTDKGKAEPCILPKTTSSSLRSFDPKFQNFLATFSKLSGPRDNSMLHKVEQNAPMMPYNEDNQAPTFMSTNGENLRHKTVKIEESSNRDVVLSDNTQGMEMTDVFTGNIVENATADDPLQCLFPTLDLYRQSEQREPAEKNGRQQLKCSLSNPIDTRVTTKPSVADYKKCRLGAPSPKMGNRLNLNLTQTRPLPENRLISQNKNAQHVLGLEEYEIRNTSESDDMDMTKSQTVAIDSRSLHAVTTLTKQQQKISRFSITAPYKTSTDFENDMDFTRCQTGVIEAKNLDVGKPLFTGNAGGSVRIMADNQQDRAINQENITISNFEFDNMEITQSQTAAIESLHRVKPDLPDQHGEMLSTCGNMDLFFPTDKGKAEPCILPKTTSSSLQQDRAVNQEKTTIDNFEFDNMEITQSQTAAIESLHRVKPDLPDQHGEMPSTCGNMDFFFPTDKGKAEPCILPKTTSLSLQQDRAVNQEKTTIDNFEFDNMEITQSQTAAIESLHRVKPDLPDQHGEMPSTCGNMDFFFPTDKGKAEPCILPKTTSLSLQQDRAVNQEKTTIDNFEFDNMEITQSQTAAIESLHRVKPLQIKQMSQDIVTPSTKWNNPSEDDDMEFTTCHTRVVETKDVDVPGGHVGILGLNKTLSAVDDCDAPLAQPKSASDGISDKTQLLSAPQHNPQTQMTDKADFTQPEQFAEEHQPCVTAPLNFNRKSLTSRLSLGNFLPKLPQKVKRADPIKVSGSGRTSVEEHENKINSVNVTHQLSSGMMDNIVDEVLPNISSDEDLSGSLVTENPPSTSEDGSPLQERDVQGTSEEEVWKLSPGHPSVAQGKKRPSPVDGEDTMVTEKMKRPSLNSTIEMVGEGQILHLLMFFVMGFIDLPSLYVVSHQTSPLRKEIVLAHFLWLQQP